VSAATGVIVAVGLALAVALAIVRGLDAVALVILCVMTALGALAVAVARKARSGGVQPARCRDCGGLNSPSAPYCARCGTRLSA
jgi:ribosomal protein L40E